MSTQGGRLTTRHMRKRPPTTRIAPEVSNKAPSWRDGRKTREIPVNRDMVAVLLYALLPLTMWWTSYAWLLATVPACGEVGLGWFVLLIVGAIVAVPVLVLDVVGCLMLWDLWRLLGSQRSVASAAIRWFAPGMALVNGLIACAPLAFLVGGTCRQV